VRDPACAMSKEDAFAELLAHGREAHKNHLPIQIGVTGIEA
jgi:hypothetical protein